MFSRRLPAQLAANRLARELATIRASGRDVLDLTQSNPTKAAFEYPADLLARLADGRALAYDPHPFGLEDARAAVARDYHRCGLAIDPAHIALTSSTSEAYSLLFKLLADAGDEVLIPRPSYPLFEHLAGLDLVQVRHYDLEYHGAWTLDLAALAGCITDRTRAIVIVSPNNPTGSAISADELDAVCALCRARNIAIIADEVFADYPLSPGLDTSWARVATRSDVLGFSLGGLSKSVGLPQVKLGWMAITGPDALRTAAVDRLELICDTYLSVSTPVQIAAADLLERGAIVRAQIQDRIRANYAWLQRAARGSACTTLDAQGGWSAVLRVPSFEPEEDLVVGLLRHDGILVHPGFFYDFPRPSFLVVSLLVPAPAFSDGVTRILRHFDCSTAARHD